MIELFLQNWPFVAGLLATGVIAGVLAGLLGVGGGIVIVPVLFHIFTGLGVDEGVRMHLAVGTSLATIIPTSIRSLLSHAKRGAVDWDLLKAWAPGLLVGTLAGTWLAGMVSAVVLQAVFGGVALLVSLNMAFGKAIEREQALSPSATSNFGISGTIGVFSAMMGIGGGTLGVPVLTYLGKIPQRAVATASGFGLIISIPGAIGFIVTGLNAANLPPASLGYVNAIGFGLITPMTVLAAPLGVAFAHALPKQRLKQAFALFLAITAIRMLSDII
ncbi:MAG: sulfite exporter TauE/SafE family protein [Pseudomonadota bacterium]